VAGFAEALAAGNAGDALYGDNARSYLWAQNVVTKTWLVPSVELRKFSASRPYAYVPPQFWACAVRTKNQQSSTSLVFRTGRVVVVGTHSLPQTYHAAHRLRLTLAEECEGAHTKFDNFCLVNMVFNTSIEGGQGIDIASIHRDNQDKTDYDPNMFPGMKFSMVDEHVKIRFFDTRQIVGMGITRPMRVNAIFRKAIAIAKSYPDYNLPASNKRFEYRKGKKRKALFDIGVRDLEAEAPAEAGVETPAEAGSEAPAEAGADAPTASEAGSEASVVLASGVVSAAPVEIN
jgi:transcription initiation factor TFIID TATA-box-binding protein